MATNRGTSPERYISPLIQDGIAGRVLKLPAAHSSKNKRKIIFLYGQHSSLERWWGLIQQLSNFGQVTAPDIPGYGGMDSLAKVGIEPTFDNLADFLANFIRNNFEPTDRLTIFGLSLGFAVITRMLQRHPDIADRVDILVSAVGFAHHDDFVFSKARQAFYKHGSRFFLRRPFYYFLKYVMLNPSLLRKAYHRTLNAHEKFENLTIDEFQQTMETEINLWAINDLKTWLRSNVEMFNLDNTKVKLDLPVIHLSVRKDRYFNLKQVERHYKQIFTKYDHVMLKTDSHGPSVIATAEQAAVLIPSHLAKMIDT